MTKRKLIAILLVFLLLLSGCGSNGAGEILKYDMPGNVSTLDPQFATDSTARMIISNVFEGLFRQKPTGEIVPCIAESYAVSSDGLVYTFHLRSDAKWSNGEPVTAHDFAFALRRMFDPIAFSPYASNFSTIKNASLILDGTAPQSSLGVQALDDFTLKITLVRPNNLLPELLSQSYASPCNQAFFESTRARYGLNPDTLLFNGPFYVRSWEDNSAIVLRQNESYVSEEPTVAAGVNLYSPPKSSDDPFVPLDRFLDGTTDACKIGFEDLTSALTKEASYVSYEDTVWVLVFNCNEEYLANSNIRRALAATLNRELFLEYLPENLQMTAVFVPPAVSSATGSFRDYAGDGTPVAYDMELAKQLYRAGLAELELSKLPLDEILVSNDSSQPLLAGFVQKGFQQLSVFTGLVQLPEQELLSRVRAGNFKAAIIPLSASYSSPDAVLSYYRTGAAENFSGYSNESFDALLDSVSTLDGTARYETYAQAERFLLSDGAVIPLYFETSYYATAKGVSGVEFSPFLSNVYFKYARKQS